VRLVEAYLEARGPATPKGTGAGDRGALDEVLAALHGRGRAAHPQLAVDDRMFAAHLGRCGAQVDVDGKGAADLHAEDLYICCAALLGDETAVRALREHHRPVLAGYLRPLDASPDLLDEVEQRLWDSALIGSSGAPAKLGSYAGRGPLGAWLGVAAQRIALMMRRSDAAQKRALDNIARETDRASADPELAFVKEHLREPFQRAIVDALKTLDDRQRMIYSLHVVDGLTVERIGAMYGVSHSTVSRWMASARAAVMAEAQRQLRDVMQIAPEEFDSLARLLSSQLDLSVSLVLGNSA
jgi:RNA polymerase sigma-70 factor (ECF subfamily)